MRRTIGAGSKHLLTRHRNDPVGLAKILVGEEGGPAVLVPRDMAKLERVLRRVIAMRMPKGVAHQSGLVAGEIGAGIGHRGDPCQSPGSVASKTWSGD